MHLPRDYLPLVGFADCTDIIEHVLFVEVIFPDLTDCNDALYATDIALCVGKTLLS